MTSDTRATTETRSPDRRPGAYRAPSGDRPPAPSTLAAACTRLGRLGTRVTGADAVAVVHAQDGHPFLLGAHGLPERLTSWGNSPLALSLADPAGVTHEPLQIRDVDEHPLLAGDPLRTDAGFRSFLCLPLKDDGGTHGTLCAMHREPRDWSRADVEALREVAASVVTEVALRGSLRRIRYVQGASTEAERQSLIALVDDLDAVVNERDLSTGAFTFVSRKAEELLGYPVERWIREPDFWTDVAVHPEDRDRVADEMDRWIREGSGGMIDHRVVTADGRVLWVRDLVRFLSDDEGRPRLIRGVITDITEGHAAAEALATRNRDLLLLQDLALLSNEATSGEAWIAEALRRLCDHVGWAAGHVYIRERADEESLRATGIWNHATPELAPLREATVGRRFRSGHGLPGRVLDRGEAVWIADLSADEDYDRKGAAAASGIVSAFGVPAITGQDVMAVMEFYHTEPTERDPRLLELATHAGAMFARVLERARADEELRRSEGRTRAILENAHEAFVSIDPESTVLDWNLEAERTFGWTREEAVGRSLPELIIPPEHRDAHRAGMQRFLETGQGSLLGRRIEIDGQRKDGSRVPLELSITPVRTGDSLMFTAFLRDVSDRRTAEEERRRRERQLAQAQRLAGLGSWEWDMRIDRIAWSDELHRIFGTDPESFDPSYRAFLERIHPDDRDLVESVLTATAETGEDFMFEHRVIHPDGGVRTVLGQGRVETDGSGRLVRMVGTAQDITDRKALETKERELVAEQAARVQAEAAEERVRSILESIADAFFAIDTEWRFTYVNGEGERVLGRPSKELVGREVWDVFPDAVGSSFEESFRAAAALGEPVESEEYYAPLEAWYEVRAFPSDGGLSVYLHDVTDRRRAEARIRTSEARYRFLSDSIPQQVWTAGADGVLDYVNRVVIDYTGLEEDELLAAGWDDLVHPDDRDGVLESWREAVGTGEVWEAEYRIRAADGTYRWHLARARAQRAGDGTVVGWYGTNTDVHGQKELEEARDRAMEDLERVTHLLSSERSHLEEQAKALRSTTRALRRSNEELDQFAYVASHDLKAPLRGIANLAQWLAEDLEGRLTDETREYLDLLQNRVNRMEGLIDGILQYSRAGRTRDEPEEVDVETLVRETLDMIDPPDRFDVRTEGYFPTLLAERTPLQQVFLNLVGNAIKHADSGTPRVVIACTDEGSEWVEFSVSDNGPGIAPEFHDRIWTIFQTLKPRDEVEGTGIGLSVVKRAVEGQGGQVWVESREGEGATFRFLWPRTPREREHGPER